MRKLILLLLSISFQLNVGSQTITIGYTDYDPYIRTDGRGILNDLMVEIDSFTAFDIELTFIPFSRLVHQFNAGKLDAYIWGTDKEMIITQGGNRTVDLMRIRSVLAYNREFNAYLDSTELDDLESLRVGFIKGDTFTESYLSGFGHSFVGANTPEQLIKMLFNNRVDIIDITELTVMVNVEKYYGNKTKYIGFIPYSDNFAGLVINDKLDQSVVDIIQTTLRDIISNGRYGEILSTYIQSDFIVDSYIP